MKIKVKTTPKQREQIESQLANYNEGFLSLEEEYKRNVEELEERIKNYKKFWEENDIPLYCYDCDRSYNPNKLYETNVIYKELGLNISTMKPWSMWVCEHCHEPIRKKYIATGHDHTDYSYDVCDGCEGNTPYEDLI